MTSRQATILKTIVEHYVRTAAPVGSLSLAHYFNCSSATIRSEMAELERRGYITHPHTSAGRIPTDKGYRSYVDGLQAEEEEQHEYGRVHRALSQRIHAAGEPQPAIRSAVDSLVELTQNAAVAMAGNLYMSGLSKLFTQPEFNTSPRVHAVASLLDSLEPWLKEASPRARINVYIGRENPVGKASECSLIISRFSSPYSDYSYIGVIGPTRQSYGEVMNLVGFAGKTLEEALHG